MMLRVQRGIKIQVQAYEVGIEAVEVFGDYGNGMSIYWEFSRSIRTCLQLFSTPIEKVSLLLDWVAVTQPLTVRWRQRQRTT